MFLHLLLQGQQLALHLAAQRGQGVPDVVGELLQGTMGVVVRTRSRASSVVDIFSLHQTFSLFFFVLF